MKNTYRFSLLPLLVVAILLLAPFAYRGIFQSQTQAAAKDKIKEEIVETRQGNTSRIPDIRMSNPTCLDNYNTWNSSTTFKTDAAWSTAMVTTTPTMTSDEKPYSDISRDINGDSLPDYVHIYRKTGSSQGTYYNEMYDCVMLNNGEGWDIAYQCVAYADGAGLKYFGDCAQ